ncbi:ribosome maturation factor RimM family protein [Lactobacillus iners LactinV 03V1-b]|nr:ribosome maturation factor RimM family protein [Lactobacillus iners LactinV 03V1-b]
MKQIELLNKNLYVSDEDQTDLPKGSYYIHQLIGLDVFDYETKTKIGILTDIEMPGANDIWEITPNKGKYFGYLIFHLSLSKLILSIKKLR